MATRRRFLVLESRGARDHGTQSRHLHEIQWRQRLYTQIAEMMSWDSVSEGGGANRRVCRGFAGSTIRCVFGGKDSPHFDKSYELSTACLKNRWISWIINNRQRV